MAVLSAAIASAVASRAAAASAAAAVEAPADAEAADKTAISAAGRGRIVGRLTANCYELLRLFPVGGQRLEGQTGGCYDSAPGFYEMAPSLSGPQKLPAGRRGPPLGAGSRQETAQLENALGAPAALPLPAAVAGEKTWQM